MIHGRLQNGMRGIEVAGGEQGRVCSQAHRVLQSVLSHAVLERVGRYQVNAGFQQPFELAAQRGQCEQAGVRAEVDEQVDVAVRGFAARRLISDRWARTLRPKGPDSLAIAGGAFRTCSSSSNPVAATSRSRTGREGCRAPDS